MFDNKTGKYYPITTIILIVINLVVHICLSAGGSTEDAEYMLNHGALAFHELVELGQYYRIITHFFMHFGLEHLVSNMLMLGVIGYYLEREIKGFRIFIIYMVSGLFAGFTTLIAYINADYVCVSAGASGAVFGLAGAIVVLLLMTKKKSSIKVGYDQIGLFVFFSIYSSFRDTGVNNAAHCSGFITGAVIMAAMLLFRFYYTRIRAGRTR